MTEFELIARYFTRAGHERQGIGDDCALIDVADRTLAITTDTLIEHVHFFPNVDPAALGHKALAVNLSDLAAAGARPRCFLLALSLPRAQAAWLEAFSGAMFELAARESCELIGGDTTRAPRIAGQDGPVTICITAIGEVDRSFLRGRGGAHAGDDLWVSGELGSAALAVAHAQGRVHLEAAQLSGCQRRLDWPQPRVELGIALRGLASAAIDVSDGLLADLRHLMERSGIGASVQVPQVPRSDTLRAMDQALQRRCVLAGGDDYELLFTARPEQRDAVVAAGRKCCVAITQIGVMTEEPGLRLAGDAGIDATDATLSGFDHFAGTREA